MEALGETIISHRQDIDGVFAAAIFLIRYPDAKVYFTNYGKGEMGRLEGIIRRGASRTASELMVISDFNLNEHVAGGVMQAIDYALSRKARFVYLDHHEWSPRLRRRMRSKVELIIYKRRCAAELVQRRFAGNSRLAHSLADLASWADFFKPGPGLGAPLGSLIAYYNYLEHGEARLIGLARLIAKGELWNVKYNEDWRRFAKLHSRANERLIQSAKVFTVGRAKIAIARMADLMHPSVACRSVLESTGADLVAAFTPSGRVSFRRKKGNRTPLHKVAMALHETGGGHAFAAGSYLGHAVRDRTGARRARRQIVIAFRKVSKR